MNIQAYVPFFLVLVIAILLACVGYSMGVVLHKLPESYTKDYLATARDALWLALGLSAGLLIINAFQLLAWL